MRHAEDDEQRAFFDWVNVHYQDVPTMGRIRIGDYIAAMPNGGNRNAITGAILKATGVRPGYPDIIVDIPVEVAPGLLTDAHGGVWNGARIEMKKPRRKFKTPNAAIRAVSDAQASYLVRLRFAGYATHVAYGYDDARKWLERYLQGKT